MDRMMDGIERQLAVIRSRQELHALIDAQPENSEMILLTTTHGTLDGRPYDASRIDVVGVGWPRFNERIVWLLHAALHFLMGGVGPRA
jgi:hypothetical protein